jgi:hypothetical protein
MKLVVYAGAVWSHCSPVEVERIDVSSYEEAVEALVGWLNWLSPEEAERVALACLESDDCVLAGYSNEHLELRSAPPEDAEPYDIIGMATTCTSRRGSVLGTLLCLRVAGGERVDAQTTCVVYYSCRR